MRSTDNLYGVTMKEPGVSMLVSVNLNKLGSKSNGTAGQSSTTQTASA